MNRLAHDELEDLRNEVLRVSANLIESIPRATQILLDQDLEEPNTRSSPTTSST